MAPLLRRFADSSTLPLSLSSAIDSPELLGALEIGIFASTCLLGIVMTQGWMYFKEYKKDHWALKAVVCALLTFELGHSLSSMASVYYFSVVIASLPIKPGNCYPLTIAVIFGTLVTFVVQTFYITRLRHLSSNLLVGIIGWFLTASHLGLGLWVGVESWLDVQRQPNAFEFQLNWGWLVTSALGLGALIDVFIAATMSFYLKKSSNSLGTHGMKMKKTSELIQDLLIWTIETGLVTSITSVLVLVCFQTMKFNYVWVAVYLSLSRSYSISFLASLNARSRWRARFNGSTSTLVAPTRTSGNMRLRTLETIEERPDMATESTSPVFAPILQPEPFLARRFTISSASGIKTSSVANARRMTLTSTASQ